MRNDGKAARRPGIARRGTRETRPTARVPLADSPRSIEWLYWAIGAWTATFAVLPYAPTKYFLFGVFWLIYAYVFVNDPERTPLMIIVGLPAIAAMPIVMDEHTTFVATAGLAAFATRKKEPDPPPHNPFIAPVIYYSALLMVSAGVSYLSGSALLHSWERGWYEVEFLTILRRLKPLILFPLLAPIAFRLLRSRDDLRHVVRVIAIGATLVSLQSLWTIRHYIVTSSVGSLTRNNGFMREPNAFGGYLAMTIALLLPVFVDGRLTRRERLLFGISIGTAATALLFTLSRGSWLALIVALGYLAVVRGARAVTLLLVVALTATLWMPQNVIDRVSHTIKQDDSWVRESFSEDEFEMDGSAEGRIEHWIGLIDQWTSSPIYGHGYLSYSRLWNRIRTRTGYAVTAHSTIIEMTAEEGLLGLIAYLWLIWALSRGAMGVVGLGREKDDSDFFHPLSSGMIAAMISLVILDTTATRFKNPLVMTNFWIVAGGLSRLYWNMTNKDAAVADPPVQPGGAPGSRANRRPAARLPRRGAV